MGLFKTDGKAILIVFIGAIITATLIAAIGTEVIGQTSTATAINLSIAIPAVNSTTDITGRGILSVIELYNSSASTDDLNVGNSGFFIENGIGTDGLATIQLRINDTALSYQAAGVNVNATYTYQPDGYVEGSANAVVLLITLFAALAIVVFVLVVFIKNGSLGKELIRK